ncbi:MAG: phosphate transporter permease subunit PstC [Frankiales bacterium]|nr:phosphate transporter permease subunit PstC [Frankiales bacterium]
MTERTSRHSGTSDGDQPRTAEAIALARAKAEARANEALSDVERQADAPDEGGVNSPAGSTFSRRPVVGSSEPLGVSTLDDTPEVFGAGSTSLDGNGRARIGDRVFASLTAGAGLFVVLLIALVALFLLVKAIPAIAHDKSNFLTSRHWDTTSGALDFGVLPLLWTTVLISVLALVLAVPVAIGIALFISQYAHKRVARPVAYVVDLLAAIPSIIYGIWGITVLAPKIQPVADALTHLGAFPLFADKNVKGGTVFTGGVILAVMILPIVTAVCRDVYERTPQANIEAAWALGATRWEMIRLAVLPYGKPGMISGAMLGLGRALGETIAISLILSKVSNTGPFSFSIFDGGETFASKIANNASEFNSPQQTGAYIAAGLVLFVLTFAVNAAARAIVNRRKEFS